MANAIHNHDSEQFVSLLFDMSDPAVVAMRSYMKACERLNESTERYGEPLPHVEKQYGECLNALLAAKPTTTQGVLAKLLYATDMWHSSYTPGSAADEKSVDDAVWGLRDLIPKAPPVNGAKDPALVACAICEELATLLDTVDPDTEQDRYEVADAALSLAFDNLEKTRATSITGLVAKLKIMTHGVMYDDNRGELEQLLGILHSGAAADALASAEVPLNVA